MNNELLKEKKMSKYQLAKKSGVPQTTIIDICSNKAKIEKYSAATIYKISRALNVSLESLVKEAIESTNTALKRPSFEVFKSNICHLLKDKEDIEFINDNLSKDEVKTLFDRKWYAESFYLLAMIDYISRINNIPICTNYNDIRSQKLKEILYPKDVVLLDMIENSDKNRKESLENAIPEFLHFNIIENEVRNVI